MTDRELIRRAEAAGVATRYRNWRGDEAAVSEETLAAMLEALGGGPDVSAARHGVGRSNADARRSAGGHRGPNARYGGGEPAVPSVPASRSWGFAVQLHSVRSRGSWGHGDLRDLADLAGWSARDLGAGFILINPLHAAEPLPPVSPSPYLPMTRRFTSPLYLRIEDIPEYRRLTPGQRDQISALADPLRARNATSDLIDRDRVWIAKRAALEIIHRVPLAAQRRRAYRRFRDSEGTELDHWAAWCALAERHGPDWRGWPPGLRDPRSAPSAAASRAAASRAADDPSGLPGQLALAASAEFHAWLQWLADEQLAAAQQAARGAGMRIGIIRDLAVGAHPGGADAWAHRGLLVGGLSVGAPPDEFNQRGQDWAQPPWHPGRLAESGYAPPAGLFQASLHNAGGLRVDHVMGLARLWCIPAGMTPEHGAYLRYDQRASVGALATAAARAGAVAIGEDLGTVQPALRGYLRRHGILGTTMLWFARDRSGRPLPPSRWRRACMATVGTHDVPPAAAFLAGEQVSVRARLGLLSNPEAERDAAALALSGWLRALRRHGLISPGSGQDPGDFTVGLYGYLARTPAALIGVSLGDAVGDRRPQNVPGTAAEYPNWQVPLCDGAGHAVLLEDLPGLPLVRAVAAAAAGRSTAGGPRAD